MGSRLRMSFSRLIAVYSFVFDKSKPFLFSNKDILKKKYSGNLTIAAVR